MVSRHILGFIAAVVGLVGLISCAGSPEGAAAPEKRREGRIEVIDEQGYTITEDEEDVLLAYEQAVRTGDHDLYRDIVWGGVSLDFFDESGRKSIISGIDAVAEFRLEFFQGAGPREEYRINKIYHVHPHEDFVFVEFKSSGGDVWEGLSIREHDGRLMVDSGYVEMPTPGPYVTNSIQKLADYNQNGFLEGDEAGSFHDMVFEFFRGPHDAANSFDEFFDGDGDRFINAEEIGRAQEVGFLGWRYWFQYAPWALDMVDGEFDEVPSDRDLRRYLDEMVDENSTEDQRRRNASKLGRIQFPDAAYLETPRPVQSLLDSLADGNGDGVLDDNEQRLMIDGLTCIARDEGEVDNYFKESVDLDKGGRLEWHEIPLILQASAMGWGSAVGGAEPPFEVRTNPDTLLDIQDDGMVDALEIDTAVRAFSGDPDAVDSLKESLRLAFDADGDGRVEAWEVEEVKAWLFYPRPANPDEPLDRETDVNEDGFLDPEELGITAGITSKGNAPPFEDRIAAFERRRGAAASQTEIRSAESGAPPAGSEFYRKLGAIQDKKLAVVTLDVGTERVDQETARGVVMFVENAFVNVGKVKVVDRAHIEEVFEEFEFQSTGAIDESTAVEIGKLSGADIIVIGSINRVGGIFYLNIKLIAVQTAEIIGSSIAQAEAATGFLEMANQAVYKLF